MRYLDEEAIEAIEAALRGGYDVEIRKNQYGVTVASVGKKVTYKGRFSSTRELGTGRNGRP